MRIYKDMGTALPSTGLALWETRYQFQELMSGLGDEIQVLSESSKLNSLPSHAHFQSCKLSPNEIFPHSVELKCEQLKFKFCITKFSVGKNNGGEGCTLRFRNANNFMVSAVGRNNQSLKTHNHKVD